jgi:hypothetical protein
MNCLQCGKRFYSKANGFYFGHSDWTIGGLCEKCSLFINKKQLYEAIMNLDSYCCIKVKWDGANCSLHTLIGDSQRRYMHAETFLEKLRSCSHPAYRNFRQHRIEVLFKIKKKICHRIVGRFLLQHLILHPTSPYIHRLAAEFYTT